MAQTSQQKQKQQQLATTTTTKKTLAVVYSPIANDESNVCSFVVAENKCININDYNDNNNNNSVESNNENNIDAEHFDIDSINELENANEIIIQQQHSSNSINSISQQQSMHAQRKGILSPLMRAFILVSLFVSSINICLLSSMVKKIQITDQTITELNGESDGAFFSLNLPILFSKGLHFYNQGFIKATSDNVGNEATKSLRVFTSEDSMIMQSGNKKNSLILSPKQNKAQIIANVMSISTPKNGKRNFEGSKKMSTNVLMANNADSSIELPNETKLKLDNDNHATSCIVEKYLRSNSIVGTQSQNFRVDALKGNLNCQSNSNIILESKIGSIEALAHDSLIVDSSQLVINANSLLITNGIPYFDQLPTTGLINEQQDIDFKNLDNQVFSAYDVMTSGDGSLIAVLSSS